MKRLITALFGIAAGIGIFILPQQLRAPAVALEINPIQQPTQRPTRASAPTRTSPMPAPTAVLAPYPNYGSAPEIENEVWLNTDEPLHLADLRGQVVLVEFWTFDCINCIHVLPHVRGWYDTYSDQGLTVISVHYPEFSYERDYNNLVAALERLDVPYPVAQDNDGITWDAYGQRYWPTLYLIDKQGNIRYQRIGEGGYEQTEEAIQLLLAEPRTAG